VLYLREYTPIGYLPDLAFRPKGSMPVQHPSVGGKVQIQVADLPEQTRSRLLAAIENPPKPAILISESRHRQAGAGIVIAALGLSLAFTEANGYRWQFDDKTVFFLLVVSSVLIGWLSAAYLIRWFRHGFGAYVLINPIYFLRFRFDRIEAIPLRAPDEDSNWSATQHSYSGSGYTDTTLRFGSRAEPQQLLKVKNLQQANDLLAVLKSFHSYVSELTLRQDNNTLRALDLLYEWRIREEQFPRPPVPKVSGLGYVANRLRPALLPALLGAAIFFTAVDPYNNYSDDELRWGAAEQASTATAYRLYDAARPDGRHVAQARGDIANLYEQATEKYRASAGPGSSQGIEAVIQVLQYAWNTGHYKVYVQFSGDNRIPPNIDDRIRAFSGVSQVIPVLPSFTSSLNQAREASILGRIVASFGKIIPGDILQFVADQPSPQDVGIRVAYLIEASGRDTYFPANQEHLPEAQRDWYTGVSFKWNVDVFVPSAESSAFHLSLESAPAQSFHVAYTRSETENQEFTPGEAYSAMADSAFDDFGSKLLSALSVD
jgi:hypothetical protein